MIKIRVPATTANLGPGFDALGLALNKYNDFFFEEIESGFEITGTLPEYSGPDNLVYTSYLYALDKMGKSEELDKFGIKIGISSDIPTSRGLGSSATCILAGVAAALFMGSGETHEFLDYDKILEIATEIEGHPDNIAPALYGGMVASAVDGGNILTQKIDVSDKFDFVAMIPDFMLSTEKSRSVLPETVDYKDAVFNVSRVSLMVAALVSGDGDVLKSACQDKLHQPYRLPLIEGGSEVIKMANAFGAKACFISGAGPTILAIVKDGESFAFDIRSEIPDNWTVEALSIDNYGLELTRI